MNLGGSSFRIFVKDREGLLQQVATPNFVQAAFGS